MLYWNWKSGEITLGDLGLALLFSIFSWVSVITIFVLCGDDIVIWKKKE